jgi:glycosyltransferase involved in cell wall biosynthesis
MASVLFDCERMKYPHTGLYHFCLNLGTELIRQQERGDQVNVFIPAGLVGIFGNDVPYVPKRFVHNIGIPGSKDFRLTPGSSAYDIWHMTYQASRYSPSNPRTKTVLTIHDLNFLYEHPDSTRRKHKYTGIIQERINRADHIVCISKYCRDDVTNNLNTGGKPISVIYNGCNFPTPGADLAPVYKPGKRFLFTLGTVVPKKNIHVLPALLKAFDGELIVAGINDHIYKNDIIREAKKHGVLDRLVFTGSVSENDKAWYYKHCEAFLFPSIAEGFGLPVIEAMYYGKPVFLSTNTSLPEVGGPHAYYFESFDPEAMCKTLAKGLQHSSASNQAGAIRDWALQFSWEKAASEYWQIYHSL